MMRATTIVLAGTIFAVAGLLPETAAAESRPGVRKVSGPRKTGRVRPHKGHKRTSAKRTRSHHEHGAGDAALAALGLIELIVDVATTIDELEESDESYADEIIYEDAEPAPQFEGEDAPMSVQFGFDSAMNLRLHSSFGGPQTGLSTTYRAGIGNEIFGAWLAFEVEDYHRLGTHDLTTYRPGLEFRANFAHEDAIVKPFAGLNFGLYLDTGPDSWGDAGAAIALKGGVEFVFDPLGIGLGYGIDFLTEPSEDEYGEPSTSLMGFKQSLFVTTTLRF